MNRTLSLAFALILLGVNLKSVSFTVHVFATGLLRWADADGIAIASAASATSASTARAFTFDILPVPLARWTGCSGVIWTIAALSAIRPRRGRGHWRLPPAGGRQAR